MNTNAKSLTCAGLLIVMSDSVVHEVHESQVRAIQSAQRFLNLWLHFIVDYGPGCLWDKLNFLNGVTYCSFYLSTMFQRPVFFSRLYGQSSFQITSAINFMKYLVFFTHFLGSLVNNSFRSAGLFLLMLILLTWILEGVQQDGHSCWSFYQNTLPVHYSVHTDWIFYATTFL